MRTMRQKASQRAVRNGSTERGLTRVMQIRRRRGRNQGGSSNRMNLELSLMKPLEWNSSRRINESPEPMVKNRTTKAQNRAIHPSGPRKRKRRRKQAVLDGTLLMEVTMGS